MRPLFLTTVLSTLVFAALPVGIQKGVAQIQGDVAVSRAQFWVRGVGRDTFPVLLGDIDGDGRADVFRVKPATGNQRTLVTVLRTSALGKPRFPAQASRGFGPRPLAFACAPFAGRRGFADIATVMTNGAVQIAHGFDDASASAAESKEMPSNSPPPMTRPTTRKQRRRAASAAKSVGPSKAIPDTDIDTDEGGGELDEESGSEDDAPSSTDLYAKITTAAMIPAALRPALPVRALLPGDFDGDSRTDLLLVDASGRLVLLQNETPPDSSGKTAAAPRFTARPVSGSLAGVQRIAAGSLGGAGVPVSDRRDRLVYLDDAGRLFRAVVRIGKTDNEVTLSPGVPLLRDGETVSPTETLAVGHFVGGRNFAADILLGRRVLVGGDREKARVLMTLPAASEAKLYKGTATPVVGDVDGNGRDDLLQVKRVESAIRLRERIVGDDALVSFFHDPRRADDPVWSFVSTANDGLPDAWKTGRIKPNGYDLAAMGCRVGRQSLIIEVQAMSDVPDVTVRAMMNRAVAYYASLPTLNPDGSRGISLHVIYRAPIPAAEGEQTSRRYPITVRNAARAALEKRYHAARADGIAHWMRIKSDPGGVARVMGTSGSSSASLGTFLHELGHQVGLGHHGGGKADFPTLYASIMSYHYHPQYSGGTPHYSTGKMKNIVLRETGLSEHLLVSPGEVAYLAAKPYRFAVRRSPDGTSVWVDWNKNGRFDTGPVRADINRDKKITDDPQGDFDDIAVITEYGLSRSIPYVVE